MYLFALEVNTVRTTFFDSIFSVAEFITRKSRTLAFTNDKISNVCNLIRDAAVLSEKCLKKAVISWCF